MRYPANVTLPFDSLTAVSMVLTKGIEQFIVGFSEKQSEILRTMYDSLKLIKVFGIFHEVNERALNILRNNNVNLVTLIKYLNNVAVAARKYNLMIASMSLKYFRDIEIPDWEEVVLIIKVKGVEKRRLFDFWSEISRSKKDPLKVLRIEVEPVE